VYSLDAITLQWVGLELTLAVDWHTRAVVGLRLSPMSSNAVDAATVICEALCPDSTAQTSSGLLPYAGVPETLVVPTHTLAEGLPGGSVETVIIDHGKMYMSEHVRAVCARLQISVQPAQVHKPTDKGPLERLFGYIRTELLAELKGYKGPDVFSRGAQPENDAFYLVHELEAILRDWIVLRYHNREHPALRDPDIPQLTMTPNEMWQRSIAQIGGALRIPARPDLVYDFLPVAWRTIQRYGVDVRLRYDGKGLEGFRDLPSPYVEQGGKWPIRYDPGDARRVFFQRPDDLTWHALDWIYAADFRVPFSFDALKVARKLAAQEGRGHDDRRALADLLSRWDEGVVEGRRERRVALRVAERIHHQVRGQSATDADDIDAWATHPEMAAPSDWVSDDDSADELDEVNLTDRYYDDVFEVGT
jgi:transposase InsO family protein